MTDVFATLAEAKAYSPPTAPSFIQIAGYSMVGDGGGASYKSVPTQPAHAGKFSIKLSDGVTIVWYELSEQIPTSAMLGAVRDGSTDDTAAIHALVAYVKSKGLENFVISPGFHAVTMVEIEKLNGHEITFLGYLSGIATTAKDAVFRLKNSAAVRIIGPKVTAGKNLNYKCGMLFDTDIAGGQAWSGCSKISLVNPVATSVAKAMQWGNTSFPDTLISENSVVGGYWYEVQQGVEVIGSQAFLSLESLQNICGSTSGSSEWLAIEPFAVRSVGSEVRTGKCEHLLTARTNGVVFVMEPVASTTYGNPYGQIYSTDDACETASPLLKVRNPSALATPTSATSRFQISGHHGYHSQNTAEFLQVLDTTYAGFLHVGPGNSYGPVARTYANIYSQSAQCHIFQDDCAFGSGFRKGLGSIVGGIVHFSKRDIMQMYDAGDQVLAANVMAKVGFTARRTGEDYERFYGNFAAGTFTTPQPLKDVEVSFCMQTSPYNYDVSFLVNAGVDVFPIAGKANTTTLAGGTVKLGDVPAGTAIQLQAVSSGGATTILQYDRMIISARY
ncbi:hypothetical protein [Mesorhizobium sp. NPDC059025]|uniref:hypothetical protein n=1 Tax=unclassified Mesorhizobium TaxID=325217 RepID=UPI0036A20133